jgi:subfamily B ATP-binding cassette protein MsbA
MDTTTRETLRQAARQRKLQLTKRLLKHGMRYRRMILFALLTSVVAGLALGLQVSIPKIVIDHVLVATPKGEAGQSDAFDRMVESFAGSISDFVGAEANQGVIILLALVILLATGIGAFASYTNEILAKSLATLVSRDLREDLVGKFVQLPLAHFHGQRMGDLVSRFSNDIQTTYLTINIFVSEILLQPFYLLSALTAAFLVSPQLSIFSLVLLPVVVFPVIIRGKRVHHRARKSMASLGDATEAMNQVLSGLRVVKAYRREDFEVERFRAVNGLWSQREVDVVRTKAKGKAVMEVLYGVALASLMTLGGYVVMQKSWGLSAGDLLVFMTALGAAYRPLKRLSVAFNKWQTSLAAAERVYEILDTPSEPLDAPGAFPINGLRESIRFEDVHFSYRNEQGTVLPVLKGVSFEIPAGKTVALVGPSGAGKSTIADLIFRFYEPTSGRILLDGQPLGLLTRESLLATLAVVSQQPFLFNASIFDNIAYGKPGATQQEVEAAARIANIHEEILAQPEGYKTPVGERGARLSGGQLQRITIARAALKDASFLLLDEATSSLDTESERAVQAALGRLLVNKTALVIAHRLSTIENADCIFVLNQGRIAESGTHNELLARGGLYKSLYRIQVQQPGAAIEPEKAL